MASAKYMPRRRGVREKWGVNRGDGLDQREERKRKWQKEAGGQKKIDLKAQD